MIAQSLAAQSREGSSELSSGAGEQLSRVGLIGARSVQATLAIVLLPALATVLVVGGVGAAVVGLLKVLARSAERTAVSDAKHSWSEHLRN